MQTGDTLPGDKSKALAQVKHRDVGTERNRDPSMTQKQKLMAAAKAIEASMVNLPPIPLDSRGKSLLARRRIGHTEFAGHKWSVETAHMSKTKQKFFWIRRDSDYLYAYSPDTDIWLSTWFGLFLAKDILKKRRGGLACITIKEHSNGTIRR